MAKEINEKKQSESRFNEIQIFNWLSKIVEGMNYLHENRIVHRDIKPSYIYIFYTYLFRNYDRINHE